MADTRDLKSLVKYLTCGFESRSWQIQGRADMVVVIVVGVVCAAVAAAGTYLVMGAKLDAERRLIDAQKRHYEDVIAKSETQFRTLAQRILPLLRLGLFR